MQTIGKLVCFDFLKTLKSITTASQTYFYTSHDLCLKMLKSFLNSTNLLIILIFNNFCLSNLMIGFHKELDFVQLVDNFNLLILLEKFHMKIVSAQK